jgi:catechol 2,3-dioxygenase-like lactoylglutathione lyase family enzyme
MANLDHVILKVDDLEQSIAFYTNVMGFENIGQDGPFTAIRVNEGFQIQLAPWQTDGYEHYAFSVSRREFDSIFDRIKAGDIDYGPSFHDVGSNEGPREEVGARGPAPTLYFYDPNKHLLEIRTYE